MEDHFVRVVGSHRSEVKVTIGYFSGYLVDVAIIAFAVILSVGINYGLELKMLHCIINMALWILLAIYMLLAPKSNPTKRNWQVFFQLLQRDNEIYHSTSSSFLSLEKEEEEIAEEWDESLMNYEKFLNERFL